MHRRSFMLIITAAVIFLQISGLMTLDYRGITGVYADTAPGPIITVDPIASGTAGDIITINAIVYAAGYTDVELYYGCSPDGNSFTSKVSMDCLEGNKYKAVLVPAQTGNIYYYIIAKDEKGNTATLPADINSCFYVMVEDGDIAGPVITHTPAIMDTMGGKIVIHTVITDMSPVTAYMYYRHAGDKTYKQTTMITAGHDIYTAEIPVGEATAAGLEYYITAEDLFDNKANTGVYAIKLFGIAP